MASKVEDMKTARHYKKRDIRVHILKEPDMWMGSVEPMSVKKCVWDANEGRMVSVDMMLIPGLYKLFDEVIVNVRDRFGHLIDEHKKLKNGSKAKKDWRFLTNAQVQITKTSIEVTNNGNGIDVMLHPDYPGKYCPEIIFTELLAGTNFEDEDENGNAIKDEVCRGGKNGIGAKLAFIWSLFARIEIVDHVRGLRFVQVMRDNMSIVEPPIVTPVEPGTEPFVRIYFEPDLARFKISELDELFIALCHKRCYDIVCDASAAATSKVPAPIISFNGEAIPAHLTLQQYSSFFMESGARVRHEKLTPSWDMIIGLRSEVQIYDETPATSLIQFSMVNGVYTASGGTHVNYVTNRVGKKVAEYILKKRKAEVKPDAVVAKLCLFLRSEMIRPKFGSQSKDKLEKLVTPQSVLHWPMDDAATGKHKKDLFEISDKLVSFIADDLGVADLLLDFSSAKASKDVLKNKNLHDIVKLKDATFAGHRDLKKRAKTICFLTEGDSANTALISGIGSEEVDYIGSYAMKGKVRNIIDYSDSDIAALMKDEKSPVQHIIRIFGIQFKKEYATLEEAQADLRYGCCATLCDQDVDGYHIRGLIEALFFRLCPSLLRVGYLKYMNTPIVVAEKGKQRIEFTNLGDFEKWKKESTANNGWKIKYYKGLGTSTTNEFKEYMKNRRLIALLNTGEESERAIMKAFQKKRVDERKTWIMNEYDPERYLPSNVDAVDSRDFVNSELIHFSVYDNDRSLPNVIDGLKTSQRKVLYGALKRGGASEYKVIALTGYVMEHCNYHHGDASLNGTITGMAAHFPGGNNIHYMCPFGQFGSRILGGADAASPRYIFTNIDPIVRTLFPAVDDPLLPKNLSDDGDEVEPVYYIPIIPGIFINPSSGIGSGFAFQNVTFHPLEIVDYVKKMIAADGAPQPWTYDPFVEGFTGKISLEKNENAKNQYRMETRGKYERDTKDAKIVRVTELPVGTWTSDYKEYLHSLAKKETIKNYPENRGGIDSISFEIVFQSADQVSLLEVEVDEKTNVNGLEKLLKLVSYTTANWDCFNEQLKIQEFRTLEEIAALHFQQRLDLYSKRKTHLLAEYRHELTVMRSRAAFIRHVKSSGSSEFFHLNEAQLLEWFRARADIIPQRESTGEEGAAADDGLKDYAYLMKQSVRSLTLKDAERLSVQATAKESEILALESSSLYDLWLRDLDTFVAAYATYRAKWHSPSSSSSATTATTSGKKRKAGGGAAESAPQSRKKRA